MIEPSLAIYVIGLVVGAGLGYIYGKHKGQEIAVLTGRKGK